jgi:putative Holliday junction resolvase
MKHLGIDYGTKRIGLAISDESGSFAFPKKILTNTKESIAELLELISTEHIEKIIIGNSLDKTGARNALMDDVDAFAQEIQKLSGVPVEMQDERFSSVFSKSFDVSKVDVNISNLKQKNKSAPEHTDDRAAAIMLQRYLDKQH